MQLGDSGDTLTEKKKIEAEVRKESKLKADDWVLQIRIFHVNPD